MRKFLNCFLAISLLAKVTLAVDMISVPGGCTFSQLPTSAGIYFNSSHPSIGGIGNDIVGPDEIDCVYDLVCSFPVTGKPVPYCQQEVNNQCTAANGASASVTYSFQTTESACRGDTFHNYAKRLFEHQLAYPWLLEEPVKGILAGCNPTDDPGCIDQVIARALCYQNASNQEIPTAGGTLPSPTATATCSPQIPIDGYGCDNDTIPRATVFPFCRVTSIPDGDKISGSLVPWGTVFKEYEKTLLGYGSRLVGETFYCLYKRSCLSDFMVDFNTLSDLNGRCVWLSGVDSVGKPYCNGLISMPGRDSVTVQKKYVWSYYLWQQGSQPSLSDFEAAVRADCESKVPAFELEARDRCTDNINRMNSAQGIGVCCDSGATVIPSATPTPIP